MIPHNWDNEKMLVPESLGLKAIEIMKHLLRFRDAKTKLDNICPSVYGSTMKDEYDPSAVGHWAALTFDEYTSAYKALAHLWQVTPSQAHTLALKFILSQEVNRALIRYSSIDVNRFVCCSMCGNLFKSDYDTLMIDCDEYDGGDGYFLFCTSLCYDRFVETEL